MTRWLADTAAIAVLTGRQPATIRSWASRGLLARRGTRGRRALYDVEEAQDLAARIDAQTAAWAATVETPVTMCHTEPVGGDCPDTGAQAMSWSLNASGHVPAAAADADPAAAPPQDAAAAELELYEAVRAVLSDPRYGTAASSFGGSHVSGSLHQPDA
jgi:hypothetical protein